MDSSLMEQPTTTVPGIKSITYPNAGWDEQIGNGCFWRTAASWASSFHPSAAPGTFFREPSSFWCISQRQWGIPCGKTKPVTDKKTMINALQFTRIRFLNRSWRLLLGFALAAGSAPSVLAQGDIASGTISSSGGGPYSYSLTFSDASGATGSIGSVWYSWVPGSFYLPGVPTSASAPTGWTANISSDSIQFVASSSTYDITKGNSLSGFGYTATFTPAQLAAAPDSGVSVAYTGGLFSDGGFTFTVTAVPEPSVFSLLIPGAIALWLLGRRLKVQAC
jgi:hypothetical protein